MNNEERNERRERQLRYSRRMTCAGCLATFVLVAGVIWGVIWLLGKLIDLFA